MSSPNSADFPTRSLPETRLLVFSRVPQKGVVKTRIASDTGETVALRLYEAMLEDLLRNVGTDSDEMLVEIVWTAREGTNPSGLHRWFGGRRLVRQEGSDLGERLATAFNERVYIHRSEKVIAIGTDLPSLTREDIETAAALLDSCDWVVGPASDGGYYLIGCRADAWHPETFDEIDWGSAEVLEQTEQRLRRRGRTVAHLPTRRDLDAIDDLEGLVEDLAPSTAKVWRSLEEASR